MNRLQHFVSCSGGKDSAAVMCLARERMDRRPDFRPRFQFCDTFNEDERTLAHVDYLERALGIEIERLSAYDIPGLVDEAAFEKRKESIRRNWPKPWSETRHTADCKKRRDAIPALAPGCRHSPERAAALKAWVAACDCPVVTSPPVPDDQIERAIKALIPSGNAFLDLCMLHGRFPSKMAKFCTKELKLFPLEATRKPLWEAGVSTVDWIGERAQESKARAKKPVLERVPKGGAWRVQYRPIHGWNHQEVFAIAKRHGLKPNPLYLLGASRVGCWPCINSRKAEVGIIATQTPEKIDTLREWERRVSLVSRRDNSESGKFATFFSADKIPGNKGDWANSAIDNVVAWTRTSRGGRQFNLLQEIEEEGAADTCSSEYGLCE